jgi:HK97 family phage portal protein
VGWFKKLIRRERRDAIYALNDPALADFLRHGETAGVRGKHALKQATVFTCVRVLSDTLSKLPCKLIQEGQGIQQITDHYLATIIKFRPNPYMSARDFYAALEAQRNLRGNAFAYIDFAGNGRVKGLYPLQSEQVEIWVDDAGLFNSENKIWYIVNLKNGKRIKLTPYELIHVKTFTLDGISGITPVEYLKTLVQSGKAAADYINKFFENGVSVKGIIQYVGQLDEAAKRVFREEFENMSSGLKNSHRVTLLPIGYQFQPISMSLTDAQFLENTKLTMQQVAAAFGIKMHQVNDLSRATFANIESQELEFYVDTMQAIITAYEQEFTYKLLLDSEIRAGKSIKFNINAIIRSDIKTRYEAYRTGIQGGFLRPNEARAWEDLPPAEGGDDLICQGAMKRLVDMDAYYKNGGDTGGKAATTEGD